MGEWHTGPGIGVLSNTFIRRDGTNTLIANWDAGSYKITAQQFESDITTGTAPFIVASTTLVSNLNADLLDDQEGAYYLDLTNATNQDQIDHGSISGLADDDHTQYLLADGTRELTGDWDVGPYVITALNFVSDVAIGTSPYACTSTTLNANLNADMLDGKHADDISPIGTVLSWLKSYINTPALPDGWVECNGQILDEAESVYDGQVIPDLNGDNRFLRGNSTSGGTGGESTHVLTIAEMPLH